MLACPPFWQWSFTPHVLSPCPCPLRKAHDDRAVYSCANMWGLIGQHVHSCSRSLMPSKLSHKCFMHPAISITLAKLTQSRTSAAVTLQQITLHSPMGLTNSTYQYALRLTAQDVLLCSWSALLLSAYSSSRSPSLSYHALFHMHSEAVCILNV